MGPHEKDDVRGGRRAAARASSVAIREATQRDATAVAAAESELAGLGALHVQNLVEHDEPGCEVAALVVGQRFRRRGIGELLMQALENEARRRGGKVMVLNTAHRR